MPKKKAAKAAPAAAVQTLNAAPGWAAPPAAPAPGAYPAPAPFTSPGAVPSFTAPPPQAPKNPFVNAQFLYARNPMGGVLQAKVLAIRVIPAPPNGLNKFQNQDRGGWYLDCQLQDGSNVTARVNVGDQRHQRLFARYQTNIIGQVITFRLPTPLDQTKALWTVEA